MTAAIGRAPASTGLARSTGMESGAVDRAPLDRLWARGRVSMRARVARLGDKRWQIVQCAAAAGVAWLIAADLLGHQTPFFAPVAAVVSLGTSYGQRLRRVAEVTLGVALGVLLADLLAIAIGSGLVAADAGGRAGDVRSAAAHGGQMFVTQAAVQSIIISALVPAPSAGPDPVERRRGRWLRRAGGGDRGAGGTAAPAAGAGGEGGPQDRRAAAGRRAR